MNPLNLPPKDYKNKDRFVAVDCSQEYIKELNTRLGELTLEEKTKLANYLQVHTQMRDLELEYVMNLLDKPDKKIYEVLRMINGPPTI